MTDQAPHQTPVTETDLARLRDAIAVSRRSRDHGQHPFGAVLTDPSGTVVLEAENSVPPTATAPRTPS